MTAASDDQIHTQQQKSIAPPTPYGRVTKPRATAGRFEALLQAATITQKGQVVITLALPYEERETGLELMKLQGIMLDWRATRKGSL